MPVFLYWRDTTDGSPDRFTVSLFSYLSPRWYPINVIGDEIYDTFEMYGGALSAAQAELDQTHDDLAIDTVRIETTGNQTTSKIYDNFGSQFGLGKLFYQDYDVYSTASVLSSYRQELRVMAQAFLNGGSVLGLNEVGYTFTGVAPLITQPLKSDSRWRLTNRTGSVLQSNSEFIVPTEPIYPYGSYIPAQNNNFTPGENFIISYSKLGTNTKLRSKKAAYSRLDLTFFTSETMAVNSGFVNVLTGAVNHIIKADQFVSMSISSNLAYFRPQTGTGSVQVNDVLSLSPVGYLYNSSPISATGSVYVCQPVQLPVGYQNYDWFPDWMILQANDAYARLELRSYGTGNIPNSIYYRQYNTEPVPLLDNPAVGTNGLHWLFNSTGSIIYDISGNGFNLNQTGSVIAPTYMLSRNEQRLAIQSGSGNLTYTTAGTNLLQLASGFYSKMWISGIDSSAVGNAHELCFSNADNTSSNSYSFGINVDTQSMFINIRSNTQLYTASSSIASLLQENPCRPHYFGYTCYGAMTYFYLDGQCVGSQSIGTNIPIFGTASTVSTTVNGRGIGLDEVVWSSGFLTVMQASEDFYNTKPRLYRLGIASGSVDPFYQARVTLFASGSHEIEFHQFSMRGVTRKNTIGKGKGLTDPYVLPIFKLNEV
jgi:hypothetical protein